MPSEFLVVAERLLERERRPMSARELVDMAMDRKLLSDRRSGKTPHQTMKSKLSVDIRRRGEKSLFTRTGPGRFYLRRLLDPSAKEYQARPLLPPPPSEEVLIFPALWLEREGRFQGIKEGFDGMFGRLLRSGALGYMNRQEAEEADGHKQIVTYVMVTRGKDLLKFKRGNYSRVADFLRGVECVGFGGHVTAADRTLFGQSTYGILDSAARELDEELALPRIDRQRLERHEGLSIVGLLNDDSSLVGQRHLGVVMRYEVSDDDTWRKPKRNEKSITQLGWIDPLHARTSLFRFEYWSQLCLLHFYPKSEITKPTYMIRRRVGFRPPHVVVVLGGVGSGKSFTTELLREDFSYVEVNSGRVLADLLGIDPVTEETRRAFQQQAWEFISSEDGPRLLATELWNRVHSLRRSRVLIDGIRQRRTLAEFRRLAGRARVGVLYVHTPPFLAFEFYRQRSGGRSISQYLEVRNAEVELEVQGMIDLADIVLFNWRGEREYRHAVGRLLRELGIKP